MIGNNEVNCMINVLHNTKFHPSNDLESDNPPRVSVTILHLWKHQLPTQHYHLLETEGVR